MDKNVLHIGLDIGSTTVKIVVTDSNDEILHSKYQRHLSDMRNTLVDVIDEASSILKDKKVTVNVAGSGGISVSEWLGIPFVQEVIASTQCIKRHIPNTDVAIELGGEDAKLTFFDNSIDQRMNETCAGGTGAFIDQMATVLQTDVEGLNNLAKKHKTIYPIAARCGVFAKTDVLPLLNEGAAREDIAASILQAVVDQTIGGLACGRQIKGNVAFLGGPLFFISELRERFIETLTLKDDEIIFPENPQLFVAMGAAIMSKTSDVIDFNELHKNALALRNKKATMEIEPLPTLFKNEDEYNEFVQRHKSEGVLNEIELKDAKGGLFLGFDVGSTTTKVVMIDKDYNLVYSSYDSNLGNPIKSVTMVLEELYNLLPADAYIARSCITGYGEGLIKAALGVDEGEVETVAHFTAARYFAPDVTFILDIGGQDMKCMYIKNDSIDRIILNEACSSGCGSFIETFAKSVNTNVQDFAQLALKAVHPVDLGSRCTVFMNSKVKQAQKEGATVGDISAGLSYSVVLNALYKVIKMASVEDLGDTVVVQGGAFYNDAVLRAFELSVGRNVKRFKISGMMGAFGSALLAKNSYVEGEKSEIISQDLLGEFAIESRNRRCKACSNHCLLTVNSFSDGRRYITGNRCEKGIKDDTVITELPNLYAYKLERLFDYYVPLAPEDAPLGTLGIPRVLNMYENYPYWFTFFTNLGFSVQISDKSSKDLYNIGIDTIPSQTVCYPAKLVHGHIINLIDKDIKKIFYPCIQREVVEKGTDNNFNCPVVCSYPEVIRLNIDAIKDEGVEFINPFLHFEKPDIMEDSLVKFFSYLKVSKDDIRKAAQLANEEMENFRQDIRDKGEQVLKYLEENKKTGVVLSGRPYHIDNEINHGIPELIISCGLAVLTEDAIMHLTEVERPLKAIDQWTYHSRLYKAASFVSEHENIEMIQLNSFGCGLDAVTTEQVYDILNRNDKLFTVIKIDEGNNLGAVRIRVRSLIAAIEDRKRRGLERGHVPAKHRVEFTKEMKETHTIAIPQISPMHMTMMVKAIEAQGYNVLLLETADRDDINAGLKYVNNDACYPAIVAVGQLLHHALKPTTDTERVALLISQTSGGCRATNYIGWLKQGLEKSGLGHVPVLSFNLHGLEKHEGFSVDIHMVKRLIMAILYGDLFLRVVHRVRPYEKVKGTTDALHKKWEAITCENVIAYDWKVFKKHVKQIVKDFDAIEIHEEEVRPRVGIVGEILIKFHPDANNQAIRVIEQEGGEAVIPDFMDFVLYSAYSDIYLSKHVRRPKKRKYGAHALIQYIEYRRNTLRRALKKSKRFEPMIHINHLTKMAESVVSLGNQSGEGWLLTGEMVELVESGTNNILCVQPFGCLPNHITGKGVMKALRARYDDINIAAVDYDPGASEVNQLNRIKLMMSVAYNNMNKDKDEEVKNIKEEKKLASNN